MGTFYLTLTAIALLLLSTNVAQAQTTQPKLNQVELSKKLIGNWKAELAKDVRLETLTDIEVSTTQGVVTLTGKVHNSEEKAMVEQKVRGVTGVVKVNNELQIQKG